MLAQQLAPPALAPLAPFLFYGFSSLVALSAAAIVVSQNIVRMSVYLLFTLCGVAGLYFMLGAELLAAIQLIVYAGGTLILIIFGVMLTSRNPFAQLVARPSELALGVLLAVVIAGLLGLALWGTRLPDGGPMAPPPTVADVGRGLLSLYLAPFEVAGVLLLIVMVGAAYMARRRQR